MDEFIVFINRLGEGIIVEGDYDWEYGDFEVRGKSLISEDLMEVDGYGVTNRVDMKKAFQPLKFYRVKWWEAEDQTEDGTYYSSILHELEEIDYINKYKGV